MGVKGCDYVITVSDLERPRSPGALRTFVDGVFESVRADDSERHRGILEKEPYKKFFKEIVPLSHFSVLLPYPESYEVQWVCGNQSYDALVYNETGQVVDSVEITTPHDGWAKAQDAELVVKQGYGKVHVGTPGDEFDSLSRHVLCTCRKKALNNYSGCTLVVAVAPLPPFPSFESQYEKQIETLAGGMTKIPFKAKRVFLLILPQTGFPNRLVKVLHLSA